METNLFYQQRGLDWIDGFQAKEAAATLPFLRMNSQPTAPWRSGFWCLMGTQFQNALSDNALKNLVILLILAHPISEAQRNTQVAMAGALFAAPFILFSMLGGWFADRFSKQRVMECVKIAEIGIMLFATAGLWLANLPMQLAAVFLMGCHSALFGPSKYGILPELLPLEKLSWGNGIMELLTFLGIIAGTVCGGLLASSFKTQSWISGLLLAALALIGLRLSRGIPKMPAANPNCILRANPVTDLWRQMASMRADRDLWRANWGNAGFFFVAALVQMNLILYAQTVLHLNETQNGLLNAALALGIGAGSVIAGYASRGRIEYRLVPAGAALMAAATVPMGWAGITTPGFCSALAALGLGGGLFIVPIAAVLQHKPEPENKGAVQGAASVLSFIGILAASGAQIVLSEWLHLSSGRMFWACGTTALLTGVYVFFSRREAMRGGQSTASKPDAGDK
jgi:acyl-[acyl-carrier-protein]-phospholipid O-acyltransferase/long-chain-fatty-acid--[acyl-carrier-protein] ligase